VTPFIWKSPDRFAVQSVENDVDLSALRWTIDYPADLAFMREVYASLYNGRVFSWRDVLDLLREHPELAEINSGVARNQGYEDSLLADAALRATIENGDSREDDQA